MRSKNPGFAALAGKTPARLGVGRAGSRYTTESMLRFRADHARAVDAVRSEVPADWGKRHGLSELRSRAVDRDSYLRNPELGRFLDDQDAERLVQRLARRESRAIEGSARSKKPLVMICVGDGLSSAAVLTGGAKLARALMAALRARFRLMPPIFVRNARVRIEDHIGEIARPDLICMIIGERPGLATAESLSAYILWKPRLKSLEPDRTVISNIHRDGLKISAATKRIAQVIASAARHQATGAVLAQCVEKAH